MVRFAASCGFAYGGCGLAAATPQLATLAGPHCGAIHGVVTGAP